MDPDRDLLVITSDHGNVEDMSTKSHTRNPVPALFHGHGAHGAAERLAGDGRETTDLTHVTPLLVDLLGAAPAA
jgi:phosphopentomutase